jgi:eukaryotic-like serine/threonine-protein kinase
MKATDTLVLPADLLLLRPDQLGSDVEHRLGAGGDEIVVTRPHSRARSLVVDASAAAFLEQFREPSTIVDAVVRHARATGEKPAAVLDAAVPLLARLRHGRFVSVLGERDAAEIQPQFAVGASILGLEIVRCVHLFENIEVYEALDGSRTVALKILRPGAGADSREMVEREAAILTLLGGSVGPELLSAGRLGSRSYEIQAWIDGVSVTRAAARLRSRGPLSSELLALARRVITAYAELHGRGVIHGDVHPSNVRVRSDGVVFLLDFGLAVAEAASHLPAARRGGLADYFEPEYCVALLAESIVPAATIKSDQFGLGSLVYLMLTGHPRQELSLDRDAWLHQVVEGGMLPFNARGLRPLPNLEAVLRSSLAPDPGARFADTDAMLEAFNAASSMPSAEASRPAGDRFVEDLVQRYAPRGLPPIDAIDRIRAPRCSINYGAAGVAWFLYRLACARGEARLLAAADVWTTRAHARVRDPDAFASPEIGITNQAVGVMSPFHYVGGLHLIDALVGGAMGDNHRANRSAAEFVAACSELGGNPDLTLGWSSVLLGCATLLEGMPVHDAINRLPVLELGQRAHASVVAWLADHSPGDGHLRWYGIAHGWAGLLFALLRWSQASGVPLPGVAAASFDALVAVARNRRGTAWWPVDRKADGHDSEPQSGWCHGSAGYVLLWTLAEQVLGSGYIELAEGAARHLAENIGRDGNRNASLCCGFAGQAYGLLSLYKATGEQSWRELAVRASGLALRDAPRSSRPDSLYKGDVGIAALIADLDRPAFASMPLFEAEPWGSRSP